jgi:RNA polymerase sigma factor (sigma-70 family)
VTDLFREHHLELVRIAMVMVGDVATAEDVVQDAFERLHQRRPRLREPVDGLAYLRSSVLNGCRSVHRRAAVARKHAPQLARAGAATGPENAAADRSQLLTAMRSLPPRQREVLVLEDPGRDRISCLVIDVPQGPPSGTAIGFRGRTAVLGYVAWRRTFRMSAIA